MPLCPGTTRIQSLRDSSAGAKCIKGLWTRGKNRGKQNPVNYPSGTQSKACVYAALEADELATVRLWPDRSSLSHFWLPSSFHQTCVIFTGRRSETPFPSSNVLSGDMKLLGGQSWKNKWGARGKKQRAGPAEAPWAGCDAEVPSGAMCPAGCQPAQPTEPA